MKWGHILAGLDEPRTEQVKRSLFSEKVWRMILGNGIGTYPTMMFVAMGGFALVVRRIFTSELRPGTEPRNLVLLPSC